MSNWLEKFNSLSRGMLFADGQLSPSSVIEIAEKSRASEERCTTKSVTQTKTAKLRTTQTLFCGTWWINLR